ncbi:hypothetical protein JYU34_016900 [Plutella xylostella]|uniref:Retrovirus-related Pol polyprotein from transposon TNT 1-94 n=1 Tax=Plutella xylostella TaxID=51655 RepID=A0ABQ7Q557_PLUXY|nr:hypothetical protein JYU34_016900 [Plutella xylostella]
MWTDADCITWRCQNCYWAEAVVTAAYIINRSPTKSLSNITPEEVWSGEKPDLSHIRIFGCRAMVHIPKERRQKLDAKSRELIFVGYCTGTKGYRFIDPKSKQSITSRDVVFLEATVSRNIVINKSASETKEIISNHKNNEEKNDTEKKNNKKELCIPVNKMITIPFSEPDRNDDAQEKESSSGADPDDSNTTLHNNSSDASTSTQSHYSDPDDETYVPEESSSSYISDDSIQELNKVLKSKRREEIYEPDLSINEDNVFTNTSFACMNGEFTMGIIDKDPQSLSEALQSNKADKWMEAMKEEHNSLLLNNTWTLVDLPPNKKVIPCKWVYRTKSDEHGNITRYKARLVIKGFQQKKGIDYHEIYAPVVRYSSMRYVIGLAAKHDLKIHQLDAVSAFLQGDIDEDIYMAQPPNFQDGSKVCKLNKSIYGLKQASRQWNKKLNSILIEIGMSRSKVDPCIYYRITNEHDILFLTVYVDDILCFYNNEDTAVMIKKKLNEKFHMKDLGEAKFCIGFKISQNTTCKNGISLDQSLYIEKILNRFNMSDCKPVSSPCDPNVQLEKAKCEEEVEKNIPYHELIGCLLYLSQGTRPDIAYIVNQLSRFNNKPTSQHWIAAKRVLRYLKGTLNTKMMFKKNNSDIVGYCDADWASDTEDRRSCSGYVFLFQGAAISWCSKRQPTIALSSTEAEYMSLTIAVQEAIWLKQLEEDFWPTLTGTPILIYCDNQSTISISGNDIYHARSKHIDVRYHFVRERISNNQVTIRYKNTEDMVADVLTKGLPRPKHQFFSNALGLRSEERVGF